MLIEIARGELTLLAPKGTLQHRRMGFRPYTPTADIARYAALRKREPICLQAGCTKSPLSSPLAQHGWTCADHDPCARKAAK